MQAWLVPYMLGQPGLVTQPAESMAQDPLTMRKGEEPEATVETLATGTVVVAVAVVRQSRHPVDTTLLSEVQVMSLVTVTDCGPTVPL